MVLQHGIIAVQGRLRRRAVVVRITAAAVVPATAATV